MRRYVEAGKLPYVSVLVARQGAIAFLDACGSGDPDNRAPTPPVDHIARYYSMTKPITTVAAMTLLEQGVLPLDDPRTDEHTSELQSLMRISSADFCLKIIREIRSNN